MGRFNEEFTVTVSVFELLNKLEANRKIHEANYNEAIKKFIETSITALEKRTQDLKEGKIKDLLHLFSFRIPVPVTYTQTYDEIIGMLKFSTQKEIEITNTQYKSWVEDNWDWSHSFASNTMSYQRS